MSAFQQENNRQAASASTRISAEAIVNALRCGDSRCGCYKPPRNSWWTTHCPNKKAHSHGDSHPSLGVKDSNRGLSFKCLRGCSKEEISDALRSQGLWFDRTCSDSEGLTFSELAEAKKLPVGFLLGIGVYDYIRYGKPVVRISYPGTNGEAVGIRYRLCLHKEQPLMRADASPVS